MRKRCAGTATKAPPLPSAHEHRRAAAAAPLSPTAHACWLQLVFSSSACVYGEPEKVPIDESAPLHALNPYGRTKASVAAFLPASQPAGLPRYFSCPTAPPAHTTSTQGPAHPLRCR